VDRSAIRHEDMRGQRDCYSFNVRRTLRVCGTHLMVENEAKRMDHRIDNCKLRHDLWIVQPGFTVGDVAEHERVEKIAVISWLVNRSASSQSRRRNRNRVVPDILHESVIANRQPHLFWAFVLRKKDG